MAVTAVNLKLNDSGQWGGEQSEGYARKYTVNFIVDCSDKRDGPQTVLAAEGLPALYSPYAIGNDSDPAALCVKRTPRLQSRTSDSGNIWTVECEFSTATAENQTSEDPTEWLPKISGGFVQFMRPLEQDIEGNAIATAAGEVFDPRPEQEDSRPTLVVSKIFTSFDYVFFADYRDKVNSDSWTIRGLTFAPDVCKMRNIGFAETFINGESYWEVTAEMEVKPDKWNPRKFLNQGYRALWPVDVDGNPTTESKLGLIYDTKSNLPITTPALLRANGAVVQSDSELPTFVEYDTYESRPFAALNLN
jgi:hypothetical protein